MNRSELIEFLVNRKFPIVRAVIASNALSSVTSAPDRAKLLEQAAAFREELKAKSPGELKTLYATEEEAQRQVQARALEEAERRRFFNLPSANADFEYWCKAAYWTLDEATALALGKDPSVVTPASMKPFIQISPFVGRFNKLRSLAARAVWAGSLFEPVFPSIFANWAVDNDIPLPDEIIKRVLGGKPARTVLEASIEQQAELIETLKQTIELKEQRLTVMADRISVLETLTDQITGHVDQPPPAKQQSAVERENMLKVIWAVAVDAYGHGPDLKRSRAVADIRSAVQLQGFDLSDDTIRRYLAAAKDHLPGWQEDSR